MDTFGKSPQKNIMFNSRRRHAKFLLRQVGGLEKNYFHRTIFFYRLTEQKRRFRVEASSHSGACRAVFSFVSTHSVTEMLDGNTATVAMHQKKYYRRNAKEMQKTWTVHWLFFIWSYPSHIQVGHQRSRNYRLKSRLAQCPISRGS